MIQEGPPIIHHPCAHRPSLITHHMYDPSPITYNMTHHPSPITHHIYDPPPITLHPSPITNHPSHITTHLCDGAVEIRVRLWVWCAWM